MVVGSRGSACSGTLIAPNVVLTAGHCASGSKELAVAYVENGRPSLEAVSDIAVHPLLGKGDQRSVDISLVRLARKLPPAFRPAAFGQAGDGEPDLQLAGFGLQRPYDEASAGTLRHAAVETLPLTTPATLHLGRPDDPKSLQVCRGDSGGPVFAGSAEHPMLVGVIVATYNSNVKPGARWSAICGDTALAIPIERHRAWIEEIVARWQ